MNNEEIDYWLRYFSNHNHGFMSEDGKKITLFKVFQELKELHYLLKIKNDYIKELQQENQELKKQLEEANEKILLLQASEPMLEYKKALEENHQKEFIEWLTNEMNINSYDISDYTYEDIINTILSKYEEIIDK